MTLGYSDPNQTTPVLTREKRLNQTPTFLYLVSAVKATFISDHANC